jgi:NAD(P)-dependent dehydrogenase (short-subunit alcohol dehydrogenase family)
MILQDKVALVTGGTSGIGRATAIAYAQQQAKVVVVGRRIDEGEETVRLIKKADGEAIFVQADVTKEADVKAMVDKTVDVFGRLDIASNNAGTIGENPSLIEQTEAEYDRTMNVNVYPATDLPRWIQTGTSATLIAGSYQSHQSPVKTYSATLYLALVFTEGSQFQLAPTEGLERAVYSVTSGLFVNGEPLEPYHLAVLAPDESVDIRAEAEAKAMIIGGAPVGDRTKYWNFVSSRSARIEQAKRDWQDRRFPAVPGETEFIPLPDNSDRGSSAPPLIPSCIHT